MAKSVSADSIEELTALLENLGAESASSILIENKVGSVQALAGLQQYELYNLPLNPVQRKKIKAYIDNQQQALKDKKKPPKTTAVAWFEYEKQNEDELGFKVGEELKILEQSVDPGWFLAANYKGAVGMVPMTHLHVADVDAVMQVKEKRVALFDYEAQNPDELSFQVGQEIGIVSIAVDRGWFHGVLDGKAGLVAQTHISQPGPDSTLPRSTLQDIPGIEFC